MRRSAVRSRLAPPAVSRHRMSACAFRGDCRRTSFYRTRPRIHPYRMQGSLGAARYGSPNSPNRGSQRPIGPAGLFAASYLSEKHRRTRTTALSVSATWATCYIALTFPLSGCLPLIGSECTKCIHQSWCGIPVRNHIELHLHLADRAAKRKIYVTLEIADLIAKPREMALKADALVARQRQIVRPPRLDSSSPRIRSARCATDNE